MKIGYSQREYDENEVDPQQGEREGKEPDVMDLPEDINLEDDMDAEDQDQTEDNPAEGCINKMLCLKFCVWLHILVVLHRIFF